MAGQYKLQAEMFSGGAYGEDQNHLNLTFHNYKDVIIQKKITTKTFTFAT